MSFEGTPGFEGTPRPRPRWHHASSELDHFAIISYRVEPDLVARHLPAGVVLEVFRFDDGVCGALVSAVVFRDRDFHFRGCGLRGELNPMARNLSHHFAVAHNFELALTLFHP